MSTSESPVRTDAILSITYEVRIRKYKSGYDKCENPFVTGALFLKERKNQYLHDSTMSLGQDKKPVSQYVIASTNSNGRFHSPLNI